MYPVSLLFPGPQKRFLLLACWYLVAHLVGYWCVHKRYGSRVDGLVERAIAIEQGTHQVAFLPVGVFDAAWALGELGMRTGLSRAGGNEQGAAKAALARKPLVCSN